MSALRADDESLALGGGMLLMLKPAVFPPGGVTLVEESGLTVELAVRVCDTVVMAADAAQQRLVKGDPRLVEL